MNRISLSIIIALYSLTVVGQFPPTFEHQVDQLVEAYQAIDIFAGVVLVAHQGNPIYHKAFGYADLAEKRKNTVDTRFDIGSMNKSFTKVVVLQLIQEGILQLEDPLGKYLEGFPDEASQNVTINHLLNHQSGFGGYHTPEYENLPYEQKGMHQAIDLIKKLPLEFPPGSEQSYSNAGYVLLGGIIESATGNDYFIEVENRVVKPLKLSNTYLREKYSIPNRAIGYIRTMRGELESNDFLQEHPSPAGGFYSTTHDILRFYRSYLHENNLIHPDLRMNDPRLSYVEKAKKSGHALPFAGGFEGANTVIYELPKEDISILVFANRDEVVAEDLGLGILQIIRNEQPKQPSLPAHYSIYQSYLNHGIEFIRDHFDSLSTNWHPQDPKDMILNMIGYNLLYSNHNQEQEQALQMFELNTQLFPLIANVWDSLGEAHHVNGNRQKAIVAYEKALSISPNLSSAIDALQVLRKK